jgi:hypothetical protein
MKTRKAIGCSLAIVIMFVIFSFDLALSDPFVMGSISQKVFDEHGNNDIGGKAIGESEGIFGVIGGVPSFPATGAANAMGYLKANSFETYTLGYSENTVEVNSDAMGDGGMFGTVDITTEGYAFQENWATLDRWYVYGEAELTTYGDYDASKDINTFGAHEVSGEAAAKGASWAFNFPSGDYAIEVTSQGSSGAENSLSPFSGGTGNSSVKGVGEIYGLTAAPLSPQHSGYAKGEGSADYQGEDPFSTWGSLSVTGKFTTNLLPDNSVEHKALVSAEATIAN